MWLEFRANAQADPEGLVGGEKLGKGSGKGARPFPRKKMNFSLEMAYFSEF